MYTEFYGLNSKPFQLSPDPGFFFASSVHKRAMAYLQYGLSLREGFIVITGEVGAGKTLLARKLIESIGQHNIISTHLVSTHLDADDVLRTISRGFGLPPDSSSKSTLLNNLHKFFRHSAQQGKRALIIVDEAQNLTPHAVEELRMLSNFQMENQSLLQSFLIGQPEFRITLHSPDMVQLKQRVIASFHLTALKAMETEDYIKHRLHLSGWQSDPTLAPDIFPVIHEFTQGIPRNINLLCDRILLFGMLEEKHHLTLEDVTAVIDDLRQEVTHSEFPASGAAPSRPAQTPSDSTTPLGINLQQRLDQIAATQTSLLQLTAAIHGSLASLTQTLLDDRKSHSSGASHD